MLLLKNGTFIDWQTLEFRQTDLLVEEGVNGVIKFIEPLTASSSSHVSGENPSPEIMKEIDCTGKFITKSFANGHHHAYSALARGMHAPKKSPANFAEILQYVWWPLDKALNYEIIRYSALVTAMACAKSGVTFVIDHHASPFAVAGSLEIIAKAFASVGISHLLCYEISDRDGADIARQGLDETAAYLLNYQGLVGLHASFTVGDDTLKRAVEIAASANSGIHMHVAEDLCDQELCLQAHGMRVAERLDKAGVLQFPKSILAHCLHLDDQERSLVGASPAWVVENMESNLNNSVGIFNSKGFGKNVMLGTDGMHSDLLRSAKAAFFAGHSSDAIDYPGAHQRFRNVHHYLAGNEFSGDGENNLVVLDYDTPTPFGEANFYGHFLFGLDSRHISHVISGGRLIVENGQILTVDEDEILSEARRQARILWARMH